MTLFKHGYYYRYYHDSFHFLLEVGELLLSFSVQIMEKYTLGPKLMQLEKAHSHLLHSHMMMMIFQVGSISPSIH